MDITFFIKPTMGDQSWKPDHDWPDAECVPRKGELVKVTVIANDGARVEREMRVVEVCHAGPSAVEVYLIPTYVKV